MPHHLRFVIQFHISKATCGRCHVFYTVKNVFLVSSASLTIACWGDSLTYGQGATNEASGVNAYPGVLASKIPDAAVYNLGIGGETALSIAGVEGTLECNVSYEV